MNNIIIKTPPKNNISLDKTILYAPKKPIKKINISYIKPIKLDFDKLK